MNPKEFETHLISNRCHLHQYPELSKQEFETTKSIEKWLKEADIELRKTNLKTGVFADIKGGKPGPIIAVRGYADSTHNNKKKWIVLTKGEKK